MSEQLLVVDKTDRTELGKCIHLYDETQGNNETQGNTSAFDRKLSLSGARKIDNKKEEGSKEEDRS